MTYWRGCWRDRRPGIPCWWAARRREGSCRRGCRCRRWRSAASRRWSRSRPRAETRCCSAPGRTLLSNPNTRFEIIFYWFDSMTMFLCRGRERERRNTERVRDVLVTPNSILFCQPQLIDSGDRKLAVEWGDQVGGRMDEGQQLQGRRCKISGLRTVGLLAQQY